MGKDTRIARVILALALHSKQLSTQRHYQLRVLGGTTPPWSEGALRLMKATDSDTRASQPPTHLTCLSALHSLPPTPPAQRQIYRARVP